MVSWSLKPGTDCEPDALDHGSIAHVLGEKYVAPPAACCGEDGGVPEGEPVSTRERDRRVDEAGIDRYDVTLREVSDDVVRFLLLEGRFEPARDGPGELVQHLRAHDKVERAVAEELERGLALPFIADVEGAHDDVRVHERDRRVHSSWTSSRVHVRGEPAVPAALEREIGHGISETRDPCLDDGWPIPRLHVAAAVLDSACPDRVPRGPAYAESESAVPVIDAS